MVVAYQILLGLVIKFKLCSYMYNGCCISDAAGSFKLFFSQQHGYLPDTHPRHGLYQYRNLSVFTTVNYIITDAKLNVWRILDHDMVSQVFELGNCSQGLLKAWE